MTRHATARDPSAYRPQPARGGADFWPTPRCLTAALVQYVLPALPPGPIWECAAGDGRLAMAIARSGRAVIATDLLPQPYFEAIDRCDFLHDDVPPAARGACAITNPLGRLLDAFIGRGLQLLDCRQISGLVLLLRLDYLQADERVDALNRAVLEIHCNWRPRWLPNTDGNPRWSSHWIGWLNGPRRPPLYLRESDLTQGRIATAPSHQQPERQ